MEEYVCFAALDWADKEHRYAWKGSTDSKPERGTVKNRPEALQDWILKLRRRFPEGRIAVLLEQGRVGIGLHLVEYDFVDLYFINPKCASKYREAFRPSGAKDDPDDALKLLDYLHKHHDQLQCWHPADDLTRQLQLLVLYRRKTIDDRTKHTNQLTSALKNFFPQALDWAGDLSSQQANDFLMNWPSLQDIQKARAETIRRFYRDHHCRSKQTIDRRLEEIRSAVAFTNSVATLAGYKVIVQELAKQISQLTESIARYDEQIKQLFKDHPQRIIYESLPGAGPVLEPRLAAVLGLNPDRFLSAADIQRLSVAPVTDQSGTYRKVRRRHACCKHELQTWVEFAIHTIPVCVWAKEYYLNQRARGKKRHSAARALAFKWIRIIFRCWKDNVPYNESVYLQAIAKRRAA